jgi:quercetin dioxygenase-like cupin family protein
MWGSFNSKSSEFPQHKHAEREWLIVYEGKMIIKIGDLEEELDPGESVMLDPGTPHSATFPEDTWYLAITIPSSPDWPK